MDRTRLDHFRSRLRAERDALLGFERASRARSGAVELDQTASGRLTRMDAMQQQAMAQAEAGRAAARRQSIDAALARVDNGTYGVCPECGAGIDERRLEAEPTAVWCIACAGKREAGA